MKIAKKLAAGFLSAVLLCSLTGCKEQSTSDDNSSSDKIDTSAGMLTSDDSNTSDVEDPPKEFHEVLAEMAAVANYNYSTYLTADYIETTYVRSDDPTVDGLVPKKENKTMTVEFSGSANEKGGFALRDFVIDADLFGEGNKKYPLIDLVAIDESVYVNVKPVVDIVKELFGDSAEIPAVFNEVEYILITADDVVKYGETIADEMLTTSIGTPDVDTDAPVDLDAIKKAFTESGKVTTEFVKNLYEKNKDLIKRTDNTYALTINKSNFKDYVGIVNAMINDGSLKKFIEDAAKPLASVPNFDVSGLDEIDASIDELKEQLASFNYDEIPDFSITYELTAPSKDVNEYTITLTATTPDNEGNVSNIKLVNKIVPTDGANIVAPANAMTIGELVQKVQDEMASALPESGLGDDIDPSFSFPMNSTFGTVA